MTISAEMSRTAPVYGPLAEHLMNRILDMMTDGVFSDPETEREFQEWKQARDARKGK